jgi:hypothetical protein
MHRPVLIPPAARPLAAAALLALTPGCVERRLRITSDPAGALVHVNDEEVGRTPVERPFTHYGEYDLRLEADDAVPLWTSATARTPWWDLPGLDLLAEALPGRRVHIVDWHFTLQPRVEAQNAEAGLLDRARELRDQTRGEAPTPTSTPAQRDSPNEPRP